MNTVDHDLRGESRTAPRALVVVESMFGNTEAVGRAVAEGLRLEGVQADLATLTNAPDHLPVGLDLLVLGAPTHAFSLSRVSTRTDAVRQGAPANVAAIGMREWLGACDTGGKVPRVAVFDTRVTKVRWLPKAAGPAASRLARRRGFPLLSSPASFLVENVKGPLAQGELQRAVVWGRQTGAKLVEAITADAALTPTRS